MPICPDRIKLELRRREYFREILSPSRCYNEAKERSSKHWTNYEQVNRDFCPDDPVYSNVKAGTALSSVADLLFFKAPAAGQGRILELIIGGEATVSAVNRVSISQNVATLVANTNITPEKFHSRSPAAAGTYGFGNTSSLILLGSYMFQFAFNAFGGFIRWVAAPGEEIYYVNGEVVSLREITTTHSVVSATGIFEEI